MKVLVTGANGFIGRPLCRRLMDAGCRVAGAVRPNARLPEGVDLHRVEGLAPTTDWSAAVAGSDAVVHLAARVHVMHDAAADPLAEFRAANVAGTLRMAEQAAAAGIGHLIFLSSIKVNGEATFGRPFGPDGAAPTDPYGISKLEAEQGLKALAARTGLAVTVLRPPLVYGPEVKGNLRSLLGVVERGVPLPLGRVANRRSLIGVDNLADAVRACLLSRPPAGSFRVFTVCDREVVSSPELIRLLAAGMGRTARLLPVPPALLTLAGRFIGKSGAIQRLTSSLEVDGSAIGQALSWTPPLALADGLALMARWWRDRGDPAPSTR
jgi:nucleoside-diphosphate-sugar epimerase